MKFYDETTKSTILRALKRDRILACICLGALVLWMALVIALVNRSNWLPYLIWGLILSIFFIAGLVYFFYRSVYEYQLKRQYSRVLSEEEKRYENVVLSVAKEPMTLACGLKAYEVCFVHDGQTENAYWTAEYGPKPENQKTYDLVLAGSVVKEAECHEN